MTMTPIKKAYTDNELIFAQPGVVCRICNARMAYPWRDAGVQGSWDCSAVLKGELDDKTKEERELHTCLPFAFWSIKSDNTTEGYRLYSEFHAARHAKAKTEKDKAKELPGKVRELLNAIDNAEIKRDPLTKDTMLMWAETWGVIDRLADEVSALLPEPPACAACNDTKTVTTVISDTHTKSGPCPDCQG